MAGWKNSALIGLLVFVAGLIFWVYKKEKQGNTGKVIQHCLECRWLSLDSEVRPPFFTEASEFQVIVYTRNLTWDLATFNMDWKSLSEKFPKIDYVFYYGGKSEAKLRGWMHEKDFPFPVIFDPNDSFRMRNLEGDMTGIVLNVEDGKVISMLNPSFGEEYEDFLEEWVK
ncbi:hypothetical protein [Algoriphagus hitonicola]|uniref:Uncharacterized protein n=1 Tax=Algoriphagus hitonicola TaxID=435880 RepID=A0A1I2UKQ1_9BACT|nr:hypothetical protein [Algoriphagus hitonicola]SFG75331.1 hypothetical protein SAMN04487988_107196 [Algoriphagus hitonicola]